MPSTEAISTLVSSSKAESISTWRSLAGSCSTQASTCAWCWAAEAICSALKPVGRQHARQFGHIVGLRTGLGAALAVEHDVPHNADQPHALVAHLVERVAMAQHAQKRLLHRVFGIGGVAQNGEGNAVEGSGVLAHQSRKRLFFRLRAGLIVSQRCLESPSNLRILPGWRS